jgi:hypothetical protein
MKPKPMSLLLPIFFSLPLSILAQGAMQEKMAEVKEGVAANQAQLKTYGYQQHTQIYYKGELKKTKNYSVVTGPDGKPQKTSLDPPAPPPEGGRLKRHVVEKKTDEMKDYMEQAQQLIEQYVPPNPQKMQQAFSSGGAALSEAGPGVVKLTFTNYVVSGDAMTLLYDSQSKRLKALNINSYLGDQKDAVILTVTFAALPNGVNHVAITDLTATAKNIQVKSTNDNYSKM